MGILAQGTPEDQKESLLREIGRRTCEDEYLLETRSEVLDLLAAAFGSAQLEKPLREVGLELLEAAWTTTDPNERKGPFATWTSACIAALEKDPDPFRSIGDLARKHWASRTMRLLYVEWLAKMRCPEEALDALDENDAMDPENAANPASENGTLRRGLLKSLGPEKENRDPLWQLVLAGGSWHAPMELYRELKSTYAPEEWAREAPRAYARYQGSSILAELYLEDGQIEHLAQVVSKATNLEMVYAYEDVLKQDCAPMLLDRYGQLVMRAARGADTRKKYARLASVLTRLTRLPGGKSRAAGIIVDLLDEHPRERALREELSKVPT